MKKDNKTRIVKASVFILCMVIGMILATYNSCFGDVMKYHLREGAGVAMEKYLEEKYDDDVICLRWGPSSKELFYWNTNFYDGYFESTKYPGVKFDCNAMVTENGHDYKFEDNYMMYIYQPDFRKMIEEIAAKYFVGEYYVVIEPQWVNRNEDTQEFLPFEDFVRLYLQYEVTILTEDMSNEDAIEKMQEFVQDAHTQGLQCDFLLGRLNKIDTTYEEFYTKMWERGYDVSPYDDDHVIWLYKYLLPYEEKKWEPKVYISTEEQDGL